MRSTSPPSSRALPAQITLAVIATGIVAIVPLVLVGIWTMARIDLQSLERERMLIGRALDEAVEQVAYDQQSVTIWDDTVIETRARNEDWMIVNVGEWIHDYYGHDHTFVLDARDRPIYAMLDGKTRPAVTFAILAARVLPQVAELRQQLADGLEPTEASVTRVVRLRDLPTIISVVPIVPDTERVTVESGDEYVHVSVRIMDRGFLADIAERYAIAGLRLLAPGEGATGSGPGSDGAPSWRDRLAWAPSQPGHDLVAQTAPALLLSFAAFVALSGWLVLRLRRLAAALWNSEQQAMRLAQHDVLTGLPNRALFDDRMKQALDAAGSGARFALHYIDLDRFKHVNDTLGHPAGDELIRQVGERVSALLGEGDTVARLGGDEFAVIQTRIRNRRDAEALAAQIIDVTRNPFTLGDDEAFVDASVGIAIAPESGASRPELMRKADIALYHAKGSGKGRHCVFEDDLDQVVRHKRLIERDLRQALEGEVGLNVVYQPLFAIDGRTLVGAEALVRWDHPVHGAMSPQSFVSVAEERGLIHELGAWVLREACQTAKRLDLPWIAVNVSAVQFRDPGFVNIVLDLLRELQLSPERLQLEITESLLLDATESVSDALMELRFAGVRIALDDFGTGYSSLQYLHRYRVDKIKIDRSFVASLGGGEQSDAIVRAMIQLASALNLQVTAEGVETPEQWRQLASIGDPELQGYLFSRPLLAEALKALGRGGWAEKARFSA